MVNTKKKNISRGWFPAVSGHLALALPAQLTTYLSRSTATPTTLFYFLLLAHVSRMRNTVLTVERQHFNVYSVCIHDNNNTLPWHHYNSYNNNNIIMALFIQYQGVSLFIQYQVVSG